MRRRELLQAVGLGAMVNVSAVAAGDTLDREEGPYRDLLDRLPAMDAVGPYDILLAGELSADRLLEPAVLAGASAHAGLVSPGAMATLAVDSGRTSSFEAAIRQHGYVADSDIAGRPAFRRRDRDRLRLAVRDGNLTAVATGPTHRDASRLLSGVLEAEATTPPADDLHVDRTLSALGEGEVISLTPHAETDGVATEPSEPTPVVTGGRLAIRARTLDCREVRHYESVADRERAERASDGGPRRRVTGDGALLVTDQLRDRTDVDLGWR